MSDAQRAETAAAALIVQQMISSIAESLGAAFNSVMDQAAPNTQVNINISIGDIIVNIDEGGDLPVYEADGDQIVRQWCGCGEDDCPYATETSPSEEETFEAVLREMATLEAARRCRDAGYCELEDCRFCEICREVLTEAGEDIETLPRAEDVMAAFGPGATIVEGDDSEAADEDGPRLVFTGISRPNAA
jgi:hypothetical protein